MSVETVLLSDSLDDAVATWVRLCAGVAGVAGVVLNRVSVVDLFVVLILAVIKCQQRS